MRLIDANTLKGEFTGNFQNEYTKAEIHALIDIAPTIGGWISAKDRLPGNNNDVLIYGEWTGGSGTKYRELCLIGMDDYISQGYTPIVWMPIPELPEDHKL